MSTISNDSRTNGTGRTSRVVGQTAYINARLVDPASGLDEMGALLTDGDTIADLGAGLFTDGTPPDARVVDCAGALLAPGLIDGRVQLREPGEEHKESFKTASDAALAGGVTSLACLPVTDPPIDDVSMIEFVARRAREVKGVRIYPYAGITRELAGSELTEMGTLAEAGAVGFTDGNGSVADALVMHRALSYACTFDLLVVQHAEEPRLADGGDMNEGEIAMRLGLAGIPPLAEVMMVERDLRLLEMTGGRYHVARVSTGATVDAIRTAKARGLRVSCDTAPHYFTLNENAVGDYRTFAKLTPPLRSEDDRAAIAAAVADGTIDFVASDHTPQDQDSKRLPFAQAEPGIVGLETLLPLSLALYHDGAMNLLGVLAALTCRPAEVLGLPGGHLSKGGPADLALIDLDRPWRIDPEAFLSKSKNSPFEDHPVQGKAIRTVLGGRTLFDETAEGDAAASSPK